MDDALAKALGVFWAKGYDGASLADLTEAMGVTKPSLYAAFGNKEALFHKALDLYEQEKLAYTREALKQPTARAVAEYYLRSAINAQMSTCDPKGCLGVISATACGAEAESIREHVVERRRSSQAALVARFREARDAGEFPSHIDPESLTQFLYTLLQGMAVQAGSGATRAELERVVETSSGSVADPLRRRYTNWARSGWRRADRSTSSQYRKSSAVWRRAVSRRYRFHAAWPCSSGRKRRATLSDAFG